MQHKKLNEPTAKQSQMIQDAVALHQAGQLDAAEAQYKKLLKLLPSNTGLLSNLGIIALQKGLFEDAVRILGRSLQIHPKQPSALNNYGIALQDLKRWDEALVSYDRAIALKPDFSDAYYNRGLTLQELNRLDEALANYDKAIILKPNYVGAYYNRGNVLKDLNRLDEALGSYESAIAFKLDHANAYSNRGNVLKDLNRLDEALLSYKRAMVLNPDIDYILGFTLYTKMQLCIWDERPKHLNNLIYKINNDEKVEEPFPMLAFIDDPELHWKTAKIFANKKYPAKHVLPKIQPYPQHAKLRVGYFSADFRHHPVAMLTAELYEAHDRSHFEIYAFSLGPDTQDDMNLRIKAGVDHFYDVRTLSDKEVALLSTTLEIDIAVDLGGFTSGSRTGIFAMQVAPIQVNYLGYPGTMAAVYMDYVIADHTLIPDHQQLYYSEKIVYLPNSYMVNDTKNKRSVRVFTRKEAGLPTNGFVFCCFNNHFKITPTVFMSWMRILLDVEGSVLWLPEGNNTAVANLKKEAVKMGVNDDRLIFAPRLSAMEDHFKRIQLADLFIDTLPYNAHTTASDALRMGLPVLTCIGQSFASRVAASLLKAVNMPELITTTQEQYEALAIELATHPEKLKTIKAKLVANLATAPLYDTALFTKHLESAYLTMYERYQNGLAPEHIVVEH
jgi:predicted O-linked N-acetylglucosamine transferase (SPINDLY family)